MPFSYARLANTTKLQALSTTLLTNSAGEVSYIRLINIHNITEIDQQVSLHLVPSAGVASVDNEFYSEAIPAKATRILEYAVPGLMLITEGEQFVAKVENIDSIVISAYGGLDYAE